MIKGNESQTVGRDARPFVLPVLAISQLLRDHPGVTVSVNYSGALGGFTVSARNRAGVSISSGVILPDGGEALLADVIRRQVAAVGNHGKGLNDGKSGL